MAELQSKMLKSEFKHPCGRARELMGSPLGSPGFGFMGPLHECSEADETADMKAGQADKFLKARKDPSFARAMQVKELSPQQHADQVRLRKIVSMTESRLSELDTGIAGLKRRASERPRGQPALERIQRSVRNIDTAIRDRHAAVDELARRVSGLRLRSVSREGTPGPSIGSPARHTPRKSSVTLQQALKPVETPAKPALRPQEDVRDAVAKALDRPRPRITRKDAPVTKIKGAKGGIVAHASVARGPVSVDSIPRPGTAVIAGPSRTPSRLNRSARAATPSTQAPTPAPARTEAPPPLAAPVPIPAAQVPATPKPGPAFGAFGSAFGATPPAAAPTPPGAAATPPSTTPGSSPFAGFAGIKLQLDPGDVSSGTPSRRGGTSQRAHQGAAKFTGSTTVSAPTSGGLFGNVAAPKPATDEKKPAGYFR
ncbi:hypothetical protein A1Q2_07144 [Trichosporon asahii var. asahii CBS 8904]|uniref:Uncharacterized protein n=1 Tax=Trichosporon asahii var. asahii (strain CBS 8904) TaxID=1220162 RepID=K1WA41_TRIAC|nr:hypothetical protein A1Q2_07144 [Trichosporon asahii var. asahii CBS 8904]